MNQYAFTVYIEKGTLTITPSKIIIARGRRYNEILISEVSSISFVRTAGPFSYGTMHFSFRGGIGPGPGLLGKLTDENTVYFRRKQEPGVLQAKSAVEYYQAAYRAQYGRI